MSEELPERVRGVAQDEARARSICSQQYEEPLRVFYYLEESVLTALQNSGKPVRVSSDKNNPAIFALIATTRASSVAKAAMDLALSGHPLEAIALSRVLSEIVECTQYLVRHPDSIDRYISGSLKLDEVLKAAKRDNPTQAPYAFGHMRGIQSEFAHASADLLSIGLLIDGPTLASPLLVLKPAIIDQAVHGIAVLLLSQYLVLRLTLMDALEPCAQLAERDDYLFHPAQFRVLVRAEAMPDQDLKALRDVLAAIGSS